MKTMNVELVSAMCHDTFTIDLPKLRTALHATTEMTSTI